MFLELESELQLFLDSSETNKIISDTLTSGFVRTVICKSNYSKDIWIFQSSFVDGEETKVDVVRLPKDVYECVFEYKTDSNQEG